MIKITILVCISTAIFRQELNCNRVVMLKLQQKLKLINQKDKLVTKIESMKKEIRLLKAERAELKTLRVHYRKDGQSNMNKLREMKIILHRRDM